MEADDRDRWRVVMAGMAAGDMAMLVALVNEFGGAEAAIAALPMLSRRGGRAHEIRLCTEAEAEAELGAAESLGASLVAIGEPGYPPALAQAMRRCRCHVPSPAHKRRSLQLLCQCLQAIREVQRSAHACLAGR